MFSYWLASATNPNIMQLAHTNFMRRKRTNFMLLDSR